LFLIVVGWVLFVLGGLLVLELGVILFGMIDILIVDGFDLVLFECVLILFKVLVLM